MRGRPDAIALTCRVGAAEKVDRFIETRDDLCKPFCHHCMRTLAIDWGEKRIGLALSDQGARLATPLDVIDAAIAEAFIRKLIATEAVTRLLVGLPLNMDGTIGPSARRVAAWARSLTEISIIFVDERLSSFDAEQQLNDRKRAGERLTRKGKRSRLDALVAANLLQAFLDDRLPAIQAD